MALDPKRVDTGLFLFENGGIRMKYAEINETDINLTSNVATAKFFHRFTKSTKIVLFDNQHNVNLGFLFVHPDGNPDDLTHRQFAFEMPASRPLNFDVSGSVGLHFDAGTWIYVYKVTGTANAGGKLRMIAWS